MDNPSPTSEINKFLTALAPEKLSAWDADDTNKLIAGLLTQIEICYDHRSKIQLSHLDDLVRTCKALRLFLDNSFSRDEPAQKNLSKIVSKLHSLFLTNYKITSHEVEELQFNEKTSELLHELNIISSMSWANHGYYGWSAEDIKKEKEERRRRLMEFAIQNLEEVIRTAYNWGKNGGGRNCHITLEQKTKIRIFETLNDGSL